MRFPTSSPCATLVALSAAVVCVTTTAATAVNRNQDFLCGATSHFRVANGSGETVSLIAVSQPAIWNAQMTLAPDGINPTWNIINGNTPLSLANNPLYQGNNSAGNNPLFQGSHVRVIPINDPPLVNGTGFGRFVQLTHSDQYIPQGMRMQFLSPSGSVLASYTTQLRMEMVNAGPDRLFQPGELNAFTWGPVGGRTLTLDFAAPNMVAAPFVQLAEMALRVTAVPSPSAAGLLALSTLVVARRKR